MLPVPADFDASPDLGIVKLRKGYVITKPEEIVPHVYYRVGCGSIVAPSPNGQQVEAGLFGINRFSLARTRNATAGETPFSS